MEDQDDLGFRQGLQPKKEHRELNRQRGDEQEIVARQPQRVRRQELRADDQGQHQPAEQAGPGLFQAEDQKLDQRAGDAALRQAVEHAVRGRIDPCLDAK